MADGKLLRQLRDALRETPRVADDDGPRRRRAALPRGDERGEEDVVDRLVEVRVGEDEGGVLAAHLPRQDLRLAEAGALDGQPPVPAPGDEHAGDDGAGSQSRAG